MIGFVGEEFKMFLCGTTFPYYATVRHESAPPLAAASAAGKARPSAFRTKPWA
ncbi:MAG: hypothetical protein WCK80_04030 [bacterium]